ncbi:MAG: Bax inhibitor-1/YccA family protein [Propionibacteriaceae bacterium]
MSNPAINRFRDQALHPQPVYVQQQGYVQQGQYQQPQPGYAQPQPGWPSNPAMMIQQQSAQSTLTMDSVVTKTGIMLGLVVLVAAITFTVLPLNSALTVGSVAGASLAAFIISLVVSTRAVVPPAGALLYAAVEGFLLGAISKVFESYYDGIIGQAIVATFATTAVTLLVVRKFNIRTGKKFRSILMIATFGFSIAMLLNYFLSFVGVNLGLVDGIGQMSVMGIAMTAVGTVLAVLSLVDDFSVIQQGIDSGAPEHESWRAAFGVTVSLVWLYINMLKILSYLRD